MYLTRFQVNKRRVGAYKLLGSPQVMHAAVLGGFADPKPSSLGRVLWRLDRWEENTFLYIVSPEKPDLSHLVEQIGWPTTETWTTKPYNDVLERVESGQRWRFRLTANPTRSVRGSDSENSRGKVSAHVTVEQQTEWLLSRAEKSGFEIPWAVAPSEDESGARAVTVSRREILKFKRQGSDVTIATATYDGILEITDHQAFRRSLTQGIGRAKGYGCGLLTIAPVS
ncbi:CRISPR system Cascade subunit CasE [Psychromicrobium silvestre]|uniref:CRISPR system Cascade subunit CasE n=1 Tax=Psychromicrobium silvestre TaxID=1645614 RepID=A0A7Y9LUA1_9MICC|nr:type I-E CRISPR-associated protein Cas6/Cse3/CasE [Psychromicrobium silvestre]NYE95728.1 CRISPR system Cascade subunit CasE [Psychromicrobium silvestre]